MKKIFTVFVLMIGLACSVCCQDFSATAPSGQTLNYTINGNTVMVTSGYSSYPYYTYPTGDLEIPSSVTYQGNTYSVNSIDVGAFWDCTGLTSVIIPNSVTDIGGLAFSNCTGLTSITIPSSVSHIGCVAFKECTNLTTVNLNAENAEGDYCSDDEGIFCWCTALTTFNIGANVQRIPSNIFRGCTGLTSISIPNSVTTIGESAFQDCTGLSQVIIPNSVTTISSSAFQGCTGLSQVIIPNTVTTIGNSAFQGCMGLSQVIIPNSVTTIGNGTFQGCTGLSGIIIPNSVTSIGSGAFQGCTGLSEIIIPNSVTTIGQAAFHDCTGLADITIGSSVTSIGGHTFSGTGLTKTNYTGTIAQWCNIDFSFGGMYQGGPSLGNPIAVSHNLFINNVEVTDCVIPDGVTQIKNFVFYGWYGMNSVTIPNSVTSIGGSAFSGCTGLTRTNYTGTVAQWCNIDFGDNPIGYSHNLYINDSEVSNLVIPEGVTRVKGNAFSGCTGLSTLTFPSSVTNIDGNAFSGCEGLNSITFQGHQPPTFGESVFANVPTNCIVNVPCGTQGLYIARLTNFYNFIEQTFQFSAESENESMGTVQVLNVPTCTNPNAVLYAVANNGYHFDHWSTGSIENPYSFTVTDSIAVIAYFASNSGIAEKGRAGFNVYPNPTMGIVTIQLNPEICNPNSEIHVFDLYGRRMQIFSVTGESTAIDISHYAPGIYLMKLVNDGNAMSMGKMVKQ